MDVCLDHASARLKKTNDTVNIHLIPSCGMRIKNANIAVQATGFVFNVDGTKNDAHTKLQLFQTEITQPDGVPFSGMKQSTFFPKAGTIFVYPPQNKGW